MEGKELQNWEKTRKQGGKKYIIKTSLIAYAIVFFIHVIVNGFLHLDKIDRYIRYNIGIWPKLLVITILSLSALLVLTTFFWKFNERRYKATLENKK